MFLTERLVLYVVFAGNPSADMLNVDGVTLKASCDFSGSVAHLIATPKFEYVHDTIVQYTCMDQNGTTVSWSTVEDALIIIIILLLQNSSQDTPSLTHCFLVKTTMN